MLRDFESDPNRTERGRFEGNPRKEDGPEMKRLTLVTAAVLALASACRPNGGTTTPSAGGAAAPKSAGAVKVEFYVMSQCPFGVQVVNAIKDVVDKLGPDMDFQMDFIGDASPTGELSSMHGPAEVSGDIVQLCAHKYAPAKYLDMVVCQNKDAKSVATNWEQCAKEAQLPVDQIRSCMNGPEGKQLLTESFGRSKARGASGSPTIYVANKSYNGRRGTTDFFRAVCAEYSGTKPAACSSIPEPAKVNVTVLSDKRCAECNADRYINMLKFRIGNPVVKTLDYADDEGKKLYETLGKGVNLPVVLFDETIDADKEASGMFGRHLQPMGAFRSLNVGASWNPVCMNEGGCALAECKDTIACRKEAPGKLEVFVMSQCPFGVKALNAMPEVLKNFSNKIDFSVHYIASGTAKDGFNSLHGPAEVDENIRELCAIKHYGKDYKWMNYVDCRNKDIRSTEWEKCTGGSTGIDAAVMKKCVDTEGKALHEEDIKLATSLGIGASPTWLANGKFKFSGIDAETVRKNLCDHNASLKGCENKLSGDSGAPVQGGCGK